MRRTEYYEDSKANLLPTNVFKVILDSSSVPVELKTLYVKDILLSMYSEIIEFDSLLISIIASIEEMDFNATCSLKIPSQLLTNMLKLSGVKYREVKTKLVASQVNAMEWSELSTALPLLSSKDFESFISGTGNISIAKDQRFNLELLKALQEKGYVGKIKEGYFTYIGYTLKSKIPN